MNTDESSLNRGEVAFIRRRYRSLESGDVWDDRPALCLLPRNVAEALGTQTIVTGTRRRKATAETGTMPLIPLDFTAIWQNVAGEFKPTLAAWKTYELTVIDALDRSSHRGPAFDWEQGFRSRLGQMLGYDKQIERILARDRGETPGRHRVVRSLEAGSIARYGAREVFVLSCDSVHRLHRYAPILVAPLVGRSSLTAGAGAHLIDGSRIAFEFTQAIQPVEDETFEVLVRQSDGTIRTLDAARRNVQSILGDGGCPPDVRPEVFHEYLRAAGAEYRARGLRLQLGDLDEPRGYGPMPERVRITRPRGPTGLAGSGVPSMMIGGQDKFRLPYTSDLFDFWVIRRDDRVSIEITARDEENVLEQVWVSTPTQDVAASRSGAQIPPDGIVELPVDTIGDASRTDCLIGVDSEWGIDEVPIEIIWAAG